MQPLIINPYDYVKEKEFAKSKKYIREFLKLNNIRQPPAPITVSPEKVVTNQWRHYGFFQPGTNEIFVNIKKSRMPVKNPGFAWTFTGYKADLTIHGIYAHEIGHYIHETYEGKFGKKQLLSAIRKIRTSEKSISGYEPNSYETFAEMMRLFILNPTLLAEAKPIRHAFITQVLCITPAHDIHWKEVLKYAHPKIISAAENWIKQ